MREERSTNTREAAMPKSWEPFTALRNTFDELMNPPTSHDREKGNEDAPRDTLRTA